MLNQRKERKSRKKPSKMFRMTELMFKIVFPGRRASNVTPGMSKMQSHRRPRRLWGKLPASTRGRGTRDQQRGKKRGPD